MSYYQRHIFFCVNEREDDDRPCCAHAGAADMQARAKARAKSLGLLGEGKIRVNKAGCLDRCEQGPVAVVYPEGIWYQYFDGADIDEIVDEHLAHGRPVDRLRLK
ncbi:MAG: (2Fe-2S) ferredoxin domain-containing protein [Burkholderiaceae bacterium]